MKITRDINQIQPKLGIPTYSLSHLFSLLKGNPELNSSQQLTPEDGKNKTKLRIIKETVQNCQIDKIDPLEPLQLFVFPTPPSPTGLIIQIPLIVKWIFLANSQTKSITPCLDMIPTIILKGREHVQQLTGHGPCLICTTLTSKKLKHSLQNSSS